MGRGAWVRKYGVMRWGFWTGILWSIAMAVWAVGTNRIALAATPFILIVGVPGFMATGIVFGTVTWFASEWSYTRATRA